MLGKHLLPLVAMALAAAVFVTDTGATSRSGLRGLVTRSPTLPVCAAGTPCSAPAKNTTLVFSHGRRVVRTRTDATGHYRVTLAPGWWNVRTGTLPRIGRGIVPALVHVLAGKVRAVDFDIDTGIR
jgi:hypothetical protein